MTPIVSAPQRRAFLVGASALVLTGCGDLLGPPPAAPIYAMRPEFSAATGPKTGWSLAVMRPSASALLDSTRIAIAKLDATMDYYADAQYPDALPSLVQSALVEGFEASKRLDGVSREEDALRADYDLFVEIKDFEARYAAQGTAPQAVVTLTAKLVTSHGRVIVASFDTAQTVPATADSVAAAAVALNQGLTMAANAVIAWTLGFPPPAPQRP